MDKTRYWMLERRKKLGYPQEYMARMLKTSPSHYGMYERGNIEMKTKTFLKIVFLLNLELELVKIAKEEGIFDDRNILEHTIYGDFE